MVRTFIVISMLLSMSSLSNAANENKGPETVKFKMGGNTVELAHWKHQERAKKGGCTNCHRGEIGKIDSWNQEFAHMVCIACHDINDKGPTKCKECHIKK